MPTECVFCKIVSGGIGAKTVYEDESVLAFMDIHPLADGHTMIIPKAHYPRIEDVPSDVLAGVFQTVQRVSAAACKAVEAEATTIGINNGQAAGQVVPHLHVHVIPRRSADGGGNIHSIIRAHARNDLDEIQRRIREAISG